MKQWIARKILLCSLLLLSISGYFLADMLMQERKDDALQEQLKEIYEKSGNGETEGLSEEETNDGGRDTGGDSSPVHPGLLALHRENPDCIGWIQIEGTVIDYPKKTIISIGILMGSILQTAVCFFPSCAIQLQVIT